MDSEEKFDPRELQKIVERLREEGRLPSAEEFVESAVELRRKSRADRKKIV